MKIFNTPPGARRSLMIGLSCLAMSFAAAALYGQPRYSPPLRTMRVTSAFGPRVHPISGGHSLHRGTDLAARSDSVYSVLEGTVHQTGHHPELGNYVHMRHGALDITYAHLSVVMVRARQQITAGQHIAITGATGRATGEHLHLSVRFQGRYVDPMRLLWVLRKNSNLKFR